MENNFTIEQDPKRATLGDLEYRTFVTNVPNNPDSIYIKVNKNKLGAGVQLTSPPRESILLNIKSGRLRSVPGNAKVTVLQTNAVFHTVGLADIQEWMKY